MNPRNIVKLCRRSKPTKMGENLLILATAPSVKRFFDSVKIQKQFEGYDLAFINSMVLKSEDLLFSYKPKYLIFMDGWFFLDSFHGTGIKNGDKEKLEDVLSRITWECYLVTPIMSEINVSNPHIHPIYLSIFYTKYSKWKRYLFSNNLFNPGQNNVVIGALYFAITFGYKKIGIMGFTYTTKRDFYMDEDGLHGEDYAHYYDLDTHPYVIKNEDIFDENGKCFLLKLTERKLQSTRMLCDLANYAKDMDAEVINYTPESRIDMFRYVNLEE